MAHPRPLRARVSALVLALLASLSAPSGALAHGVAHDHMRTAHHAPVEATRDHERGHADAHADAHDRLVVRPDDSEHDVEHVADHGGAHRHADGGPAEPTRAAHHTLTTHAALLSSSQVAPAEHTHRHAHPTVDRAAWSRDTWRLAVTTLAAVLPVRCVLLDVAVVQHAPAVPEGACLARPAPESGPPPSLRAPPLS